MSRVEMAQLMCLIIFLTFTAMLLGCIRAYFKMKKCNCLTSGTIIEIRVTKDKNKNLTTINYQPIYRYTVSGIDYVNEGSMMSTNPKEYKLKGEVPLYYEENNPNNFIPGSDVKYLKRNIIIMTFMTFLALLTVGMNVA